MKYFSGILLHSVRIYITFFSPLALKYGAVDGLEEIYHCILQRKVLRACRYTQQ